MTNLKRNVASGAYEWSLNVPLFARADVMSELRGWPDQLGARRFDGPTLFLRGANSKYVRFVSCVNLVSSHDRSRGSDAAFEAARAHWFPAAQLVTIEKAGHWVHAEAPQQFESAIEAFVTEEEEAEN